MRHTIAGLIAGAAFAATLASAPAQACTVTDPCSGYGAYGYYGNYGGAYGYGCGAGYGYCGYGARERLPDPTGPYSYEPGPQYYYVNRGPTYTGPGDFAPIPTYQERAVSGWQAYSRPYYYGYNGGPYGNATSHYYDGAPGVQGPAIYTYNFPRRAKPMRYRQHRPAPKYYYTGRPSIRYGYATGQRRAPSYAAPRAVRTDKPRT